MRRIAIAVLAMLALDVGAARADGRENAIQHLASVYAMNALCPEIETNDVLIAVLATGVGIDIVTDKDAITVAAMAKMMKLKSNSQEAICATGLFLYGPKGVNVKGLLREK